MWGEPGFEALTSPFPHNSQTPKGPGVLNPFLLGVEQTTPALHPLNAVSNAVLRSEPPRSVTGFSSVHRALRALHSAPSPLSFLVSLSISLSFFFLIF